MKTSVLYATEDKGRGLEVQKAFFEQFNGTDGVSLTLHNLSLAGILNLKRRGFNVLLVDYSLLIANLDKSVTALKKFFEKTPSHLIVVLCDNEQEKGKATGNLYRLTEQILNWNREGIRGICQTVRRFAKATA